MRRRLVKVVSFVVVALVVVSLAAVGYALSWYRGIDRVSIVHADPVHDSPTVGSVPIDDTAVGPAMNVLLTGSDGRSCIDPDSPTAGAFLADGVSSDVRSDTILLLRADPAGERVAMLSFPRDLWLSLAGADEEGRINSAFDREDPSRLIQTIEANFGLRIDHYVGVDFCAFKVLVDAADGVSIPFDYPARDRRTGFEVSRTGCHTLSGDEALAYVRSRHYEYRVDGAWVSDESNDFGRIARQQDLLRRLATQAIDRGLTDPVAARRLLDVARSSDVVIDDDLGLTELADIIRIVTQVGPEQVEGYRIDGQREIIGGADVIVPDLTSDETRSIVSQFRPDVSGTKPATTPTSNAPSSPHTPTVDLPAAGIVPSADVSC